MNQNDVGPRIRIRIACEECRRGKRKVHASPKTSVVTRLTIKCSAMDRSQDVPCAQNLIGLANMPQKNPESKQHKDR
jgi:hypothetical protein